MRPEAIQNERDRIGSTKRNRKIVRLPHHQNVSNSVVSPSYGGSPVDERNSESDDASPSASAISTLNGTHNNSQDASHRLIENLMDIEHCLDVSRGVKTEPANSRQQIIQLLINWSNMLHPLADIPFTDKVRTSTITTIISMSRFTY